MKKACLLFLLIFTVFLSCKQKKENLYTMGIFQVNDAPHLNVVREGFIKCLEDNGYVNGENIRLILRNGKGSLPEVQRIAQEFVSEKVDIIVALSTPCLQAAIHATRGIPIVFSSVANPFLAGAGRSDNDHLRNVSGVSSKGPIKQGLVFIKEVMPNINRIGTLWTPAELNSEYYLSLVQEGASELGFEIKAIPIQNPNEVLLATEILINKNIDIIYQISDNTINACFEALGQVAADNRIPLFGGFLLSTKLGACAALGWDFFDMGYKAGRIALRVKNGESPADIPFEYMEDVKLHLNLKNAEKQKVHFSEEILKRADEIIQ